uniref:CAZy families PL11/CE12 protein n=1 Tax=uncultured Butyrivibrio sp. TaxID=370801 RepID=A0A060CSC3_9FIRM|nr:CAZy families PL11/CE12 protein [uncultured Butyrivibrio sp.]
MGWGQRLIHFFHGGYHAIEKELETCPYPQARIYETDTLHLQNRAIGGRSSRSFIEEGKWDNVLTSLAQDQFVFCSSVIMMSTSKSPTKIC